jgi:hypothetical protein
MVKRNDHSKLITQNSYYSEHKIVCIALGLLLRAKRSNPIRLPRLRAATPLRRAGTSLRLLAMTAVDSAEANYFVLSLITLNFQLPFDHFENLIKHGFRQLSGLGVLLAGMVAGNQSL